jgi:type II secretion system protein N
MSVSPPPPSVKRSSWPRKLLFVLCALLVLVVIAWFVVTSGAFFKGVVLPRASQAVGAQITAGDVSLSPFSQVTLTQLKVAGAGGAPILEAAEVRLRYNLMSIIHGNIKVDEVTLDSPSINVVENSDGTRNIDSLLKSNKPASPSATPASSTSKTPQVEIRNITVKNASLHYVKHNSSGGDQVVELSGINVGLDQLINGQNSKFNFAAAGKISGPPDNLLEGKCDAEVSMGLGPDLMPRTLTLKANQQVLKAQGAYQTYAGFRSALSGEMTPTEVKGITESFYRNDQLLGEVKLSGPLDLSKKEGHLTLAAGPFNRDLLNFLGGAKGLDFGSTTLSANGDLSLKNGGTLAQIKAQLGVTNLSMSKPGQTMPSINFEAACDITADLKNNTAQVQTLTLDGQQAQRRLIHGDLTKPMTVAWGGNAAAPGDSTFEVVVSDFDLTQWRALIGDSISAGTVNLHFTLASTQGGKTLDAGLTTSIAGLAAGSAATGIRQGALDVKLDAQVTDLKKFALSGCKLSLTEQGQPALQVDASATYDGAAFTLQSRVEAVLARLIGKGSTSPLKLGIDVAGSFSKQVFDLNKASVSLPSTSRAAKNELQLSGQLDLSKATVTEGRLDVKADTLDTTPLYDAITGQTSQSTTAPAQTASGPDENKEPDAVKLPVKFNADVNIAQAWLREISAQNCRISLKVSDNKIVLDPFSVTVNGGTAGGTASVDLGTKGYVYATDLTVSKVPLEPLANSFSPENAGKYKGDILAIAKINGAGVTGVSLKKTLTGQAGFTFTNADIQLTGPKMKKVVQPIALLLGLSEVADKPLNWVDAKVDMGGGNITVSRCVVESPAFEGTLQGAIPISDTLSNSPLNLPLHLALRNSLAKKIGMTSTNTASGSDYTPMKDFVTVKGTLGQPHSDVDKMAIGGLLLNTGVGMVEKLGGKVGEGASGVISGLGGLLNRSKQAPSTNQPATNSPAKSNPLDLFKR